MVSALADFGAVVLLGLDQVVEDLDGIIFVGADAALEDFLLATFGVEIPGAAAVLDDGNGEGPVFRADIKRDGLIRLDDHAMHLFVAADKIVGHVLVGDFVASVDNVAGIRAKNDHDRLAVVGFGSGEEGQRGFAGRRKGFLVGLLRERRASGEERCENCSDQRERKPAEWNGAQAATPDLCMKLGLHERDLLRSELGQDQRSANRPLYL